MCTYGDIIHDVSMLYAPCDQTHDSIEVPMVSTMRGHTHMFHFNVPMVSATQWSCQCPYWLLFVFVIVFAYIARSMIELIAEFQWYTRAKTALITNAMTGLIAGIVGTLASRCIACFRFTHIYLHWISRLWQQMKMSEQSASKILIYNMY